MNADQWGAVVIVIVSLAVLAWDFNHYRKGK